MVRLILRRKIRDQWNGLETDALYTLDVECPELESHLRRSGFSENGYDTTQLVDAEIIEAASAAGE